MNLLTIWELRHTTRMELRLLLDRMLKALNDYPEGSFQRETACTNIRNIRWVLADYSALATAPSPRYPPPNRLGSA